MHTILHFVDLLCKAYIVTKPSRAKQLSSR